MIRKLLLLVAPAVILTAPVVISASSYALDGGAKSGFTEGLDDTGGTSAQDCKDAGGTVKSGKCVDSNGNQVDPVGLNLQNIINILLYISGIIAVIYIVIAGFRYITSNGDSSSISKAKNNIMYALIGLVVAIMAYAIVNFVLGKL